MCNHQEPTIAGVHREKLDKIQGKQLEAYLQLRYPLLSGTRGEKNRSFILSIALQNRSHIINTKGSMIIFTDSWAAACCATRLH